MTKRAQERRLSRQPKKAALAETVQPQRDHVPDNLDRGLKWLLQFDTKDLLAARVERVRETVVQQANATAADQAYEPITDDRVAWYLLLARTAIEAPTNLDTYQAARVLPFVSAIGRYAKHLDDVGRVDERVTRWLSKGEAANPDSVLFELLVAAAYQRDGWAVEFLRELSTRKQPDFSASRGASTRLVECKRMSMRSQVSREESGHWRRLWRPLCDALVADHAPWILDIAFHRDMHTYGDGYLLDRLRGKLSLAGPDGVIVDDDELRVHANRVDQRRIVRELKKNYAKCGSTREVELLTGQTAPALYRFSAAVAGTQAVAADASMGRALYWDRVNFAVGAFWECDAATSIERKARDILRHLAEANEQLAGTTPSSVHIGIETLDSDRVEEIRWQRIQRTVSAFRATGSALDWVYCHLFQPEAPSHTVWDLAETTSRHPIQQVPQSWSGQFLIVPDENSTPGAHWRRPL